MLIIELDVEDYHDSAIRDYLISLLSEGCFI